MEEKKGGMAKRIVAGILIMILLFFMYPIRMPRPLIWLGIYVRTPYGTSWDDAVSIIEKKRSWRIMGRNTELAYSDGQGRIEGMHIRADIGKSGYFWYLKAIWSFDTNGKLTKIYIFKSLDV
ncbi:MAG: hypothetical protein FWG88_10970 [Oscillospiraceae bacterium]|nr:hypothetical protein [Oscillospiraceae bacterium]